MNGFEVIKVVVVTVAFFDSASWKSATLEATILAKKRMRKKLILLGLFGTIN